MCACQEDGEQAGIWALLWWIPVSLRRGMAGGSAPSGSTENLRDQTCLAAHSPRGSAYWHLLQCGMLSHSVISGSL